MSRKYRIGIAGLAHMHVNNVAELFRQHPQAELAACADTKTEMPELREAPYTRGWNLKHVMGSLGVPKKYDDYRQMLDEEELDIVICCSENVWHAEIVEACAARKVNVCIEKPMAMSLEHAMRMVRAAQKAGIALLVNWPLTWERAARTVKCLIDDGMIGRIIQVKHRAAHGGPLGAGAKHAGVTEAGAALTPEELAATWWHHESTGGGAMLDFCCYGCMAARWYIGQCAVAAMGMRANLNSQWADAEDNGLMIVRYPEALGLFEGSWTQLDPGVPSGPIVYGQTGTLVVDSRNGKPIVRLERGHGHTTVFTPEPLPEECDTIAKAFIRHLETGEAVHPTLEMGFNLECMATLDAGLRSARSGKQEPVDAAACQISQTETCGAGT